MKAKNTVTKIVQIFMVLFTLIVVIVSIVAFVRFFKQLADVLDVSDIKIVPHEKRWGIYSLNLGSEEVQLLYSSDKSISSLSLYNDTDRFVFSQKADCSENECEEIYTLSLEGNDLQRITNNRKWDLYPVWSPDGSQIAFLRFNETLDIYIINTDGSSEQLLFDSSFHDSDINWRNDKITFTRNSQIWIMNSDGTSAIQVTDLSNAGEENNANLPFGDYDPRISPDGEKIIFERLVDDESPHGNYDFFNINIDGTGEERLTDSGYSQGIVSWSNDGTKLVYIVSAIDNKGKFDIYVMNSDGSESSNITPSYFPIDFLCHSPLFSKDDSMIYFIGEWWE
ncbi:TolB family protein [Patescibacteria group bacterium]